MTAPNFIIAILDDLGPDRCGLVDGSTDAARLPFLSMLKRSGVWFPNHYTENACSPTRADLWTGRYPSEHKVGGAIKVSQGEQYAMDTSLPTWPKVLRDQMGYQTYLVGKHHLSHTADPVADAAHPGAIGFSGFVGTLGNVVDHFLEDPWIGLVDTIGVPVHSTVRCSVESLNPTRGVAPFAIVVSFLAPHAPYEPDSGTYTSDTSTDLGMFCATAEGIDYGLGVLWSQVPPATRKNTWLIVCADNGTPADVTTFPLGQGKGTMYEGGIKTWAVAYHEDMVDPGRTHHGLVHIADYAATILELAGAPTVDFPGSVSFANVLQGNPGSVPGRQEAFAEKREPIGCPDDASCEKKIQAVRNGTHKLIRWSTRQPGGSVTVNRKLLSVPLSETITETELAMDEAIAGPLGARIDAELGGVLT